MTLARHTRSFCDSLHTMSLYIDMKMILPLSCSGSQFKSFNNFWISRRMCNVVCPGFIIHSNSIGSPSILSNSLHESFQFGSPFIVWLRERTYLPKTQYRVWEYVNFCLREIDYLFVVLQGQSFPWRSRRTYFWHSWDFQSLFLNQSLCHIEEFLYRWLLICISDGVQILRSNLLQERWLRALPKSWIFPRKRSVSMSSILFLVDDLTSSVLSCSLFLWIKLIRQKEYCILLMSPHRRRWQNPE